MKLALFNKVCHFSYISIQRFSFNVCVHVFKDHNTLVCTSLSWSVLWNMKLALFNKVCHFPYISVQCSCSCIQRWEYLSLRRFVLLGFRNTNLELFKKIVVFHIFLVQCLSSCIQRWELQRFDMLTALKDLISAL